MRLRMKRMLLAVLAAAMSLVLSGCFVKTVDELYTLPKHSDEYNRLEQAIDQVMSSQNASYAAPVSGMVVGKASETMSVSITVEAAGQSQSQSQS